MNNESIVMAENICPVCGSKHTYNTEILIHKRMGTIKEDERVTGYGLCEEHDALYQDGMIGLIEISNVTDEDDDTYNMADVDRTGRLVYVNAESFNMPLDEPVAFVSVATFDYIVELYEEHNPPEQLH